mmetsp:Transcript_118262/g.341879  ORF Transcript_118262/g.341879 Transcript_118262/m.341879 type:complete len:210 (-) Transcript_118262:318-947(-)
MKLHQLVGVELQHLVRLVRQLARGRDDEAEGALLALHLRAELQLEGPQDHRQTEHQRLATSCEGDANHVAAAEDGRDALHLDLCRSLDAFRLEPLQNAPRQPHVLETLHRSGHVLPVDLDKELLADSGTLRLGHLQVLPQRAPTTDWRHPLGVDDAFGALSHGHQWSAKLELHLFQDPTLLVLDRGLLRLLARVPVRLLLGADLLRHRE